MRRTIIIIIFTLFCVLSLRAQGLPPFYAIQWGSSDRIVVADVGKVLVLNARLELIDSYAVFDVSEVASGSYIWDVKVSAGGQYLAFLSYSAQDGKTRLAVWDLTTHTHLQTISDVQIWEFTWHQTRPILAVSESIHYDAEKIRFYSFGETGNVSPIRLQNSAITLAWSSEDILIEDGGVNNRIWDTSTTPATSIREWNMGRITDIVPSPTGTEFAAVTATVTPQYRIILNIMSSTSSDPVRTFLQPLQADIFSMVWMKEGLLLRLDWENIVLRDPITGVDISGYSIPSLAEFGVSPDETRIFAVDTMGIGTLRDAITGKILVTVDLNNL
jgi:hypothetical protein